MLSDISLSNIFWICLLKQGKQKQNKRMGFHLKEKLFNRKEIVHKMKRQPTEHEKIFANNISEKGFISKTDKEFMQLNL